MRTPSCASATTTSALSRALALGARSCARARAKQPTSASAPICAHARERARERPRARAPMSALVRNRGCAHAGTSHALTQCARIAESRSRWVPDHLRHDVNRPAPIRERARVLVGRAIAGQLGGGPGGSGATPRNAQRVRARAREPCPEQARSPRASRASAPQSLWRPRSPATPPTARGTPWPRATRRGGDTKQKTTITLSPWRSSVAWRDPVAYYAKYCHTSLAFAMPMAAGSQVCGPLAWRH